MFQNTLNVARKYGAKVSTGVTTLAFSALALAEDDGTSAAITSAGAKMLAYATAVIGIMVAFWGIKRAGQKMGWW